MKCPRIVIFLYTHSSKTFAKAATSLRFDKPAPVSVVPGHGRFPFKGSRTFGGFDLSYKITDDGLKALQQQEKP